MTNYSDNSFAPGMVSDAYLPDQLIAGDMKVVTDSATITGGAALKRGSVLGRIQTGAQTVTPGAVVSGSGGTPGNGAIGTVTADAGAQEGTYQIRILNPAANAGSFEVLRPDGTVDGNGTVAVAYNGMINFTLADGSTDFVEDDRIPVVVSYAAGEAYKLAASASLDGSQTPVAILADDVDASGGDKIGGVYLNGEFNGNSLTLGVGITLAAATAALRRRNIFIKTPVSAADPT